VKTVLACGLALLVLAAALALIPAEAQSPRRGGGERIAVVAQAIEAFDPRDPARTVFGALKFRGGLVLTSSHRHFGGISALHVEPDGERFVAVTDKGRWLRGRIVYRDERPIAIADADIAPILGADGRPLSRRGWYDTESLAEDGGTFYVGIERVNEIVRLNFGRDGVKARAVPIAVPPAVKALPYNRGLECLAMAPRNGPLAGTLIAISERGLDERGNIQGFLIGGAGGAFALKRSEDFDVSDCTLAPRGRLLVLERRFTWLSGVAMRIRSIPLARVQPGALLDGVELMSADMAHQIDNMEGLAVHRAGDGQLVLTLVSDDNFSALQRTLLLQFTLAE
jgi:hypothetical protein